MIRVLSFCVLAGLTACETEVTQLLITIESDLAVPDELDEVRVRFIDFAGRPIPEPETVFDLKGTNLNRVVSFAVIPGDSPLEQTVNFEFSARRKGILLFYSLICHQRYHICYNSFSLI